MGIGRERWFQIDIVLGFTPIGNRDDGSATVTSGSKRTAWVSRMPNTSVRSDGSMNRANFGRCRMSVSSGSTAVERATRSL